MRETVKTRRRAERRTAAQQALLEEYAAALERLREARAAFQRVTDPELIAACVYEVNAAQTRCSYLMTRLKEEQVTQMYVLR